MILAGAAAQAENLLGMGYDNERVTGHKCVEGEPAPIGSFTGIGVDSGWNENDPREIEFVLHYTAGRDIHFWDSPKIVSASPEMLERICGSAFVDGQIFGGEVKMTIKAHLADPAEIANLNKDTIPKLVKTLKLSQLKGTTVSFVRIEKIGGVAQTLNRILAQTRINPNLDQMVDLFNLAVASLNAELKDPQNEASLYLSTKPLTTVKP